LIPLLILILSASAPAGELSASAQFSSSTAAVGEAVELQITVQGTQKAEPPELKADGLSIQFRGTQKAFNMTNGDVTSSAIFTYIITPLKEGTWTFPAIALEAAGKQISTAPVTLTVSGSAGHSGGGATIHAPGSLSGSASAGGPQNLQIATAEWVTPKTTAYVGETVPVELRLYVNPKIRCQLQQMPALSGDGLLFAPIPQPQQKRVTKDGHEWEMVTFKTAFVPVKSGSLALPAVDIHALAVLPVQRPAPQRRSGVPHGFEQFFSDAFNDPFFDNAFQQQQAVTIRPQLVELEIKPIPEAGKPQDFSGAVGNFTLKTEAAPLRVSPGDPVTLKAMVSGTGSFDRMGAPILSGSQGWRVYPPSGKFEPGDDLGLTGTKTFEMAVIPEAPARELPPLRFTFFNPATAQYETLTGNPLPVIVEGAAIAAQPPGAATAQNSAVGLPLKPENATANPTIGGASSALEAGSQPAALEYIRVDAGRETRFAPVWHTPVFWAVQAGTLAALLLLGGWQWRRQRLKNGPVRLAAKWRQTKAETLRQLRSTETAAADFYRAAVRAIQLETALRLLSGAKGARNPEPPTAPESLDADRVCASLPIERDTEVGVRRLFAQHDEWRYAGGGETAPLPPERRRQILELLESFKIL
jgi:hypothetical protein